MVSSNLSDNAVGILKLRYLIKDENTGEVVETPSEMFRRVAKAIAESEKTDSAKLEYEDIYYDMMSSLDFIPNSPTLMNAGTGAGTLSACYVLPIEDNMDSIMSAAYDQAFIEKYGGGVGFPLSNIRPEGAGIKTTQGKACGPVSVLRLLSEVGKMITQGGKRDGAHMAIMSIYHPDIEKFITCKTVEGDLKNFNISVGADSTFMEAVKHDHYMHLTWPMDKNVYDKPWSDDGKFIKARDLFSTIIKGAHRNGEPGMVWLDRMNEDNATPHIADIQTTNPCGEQPLLGNESCNLGSINVANFTIHSPSGKTKFDMARFKKVIPHTVRFLDSVVDVNLHPTDATSDMNKRTRKIGLGIMGWADLLYQLGIPYNSADALNLANKVGKTLQEMADKTSVSLAVEFGSFPEFEKSPLNKKNGGQWDAMRNAWRLSIAPTGTIAMIADTANSIEPQFALAYTKKNLSAALENEFYIYKNKYFLEAMDKTKLSVADKEEIIIALDKGKNFQEMSYEAEGFTQLQELFLTAADVAPEEHVAMQSVFQKYVDSGISKTINLPKDITENEVREAYTLAWESGCKGITVYRTGSRDKEVLVAGTSDNAKFISETDEEWKRPNEMIGTTSKIQTGHGSLYVTMNKDGNNQIKEVVAWTGKSGACEHAGSEAIGRLISTAIQFGVPIPVLVKQLRGIECCPQFWNGQRITSPPDGIAQILENTFHTATEPISTSTVTVSDYVPKNEQEAFEKGLCLECGTSLIPQSGCDMCPSCGWGRCD